MIFSIKPAKIKSIVVVVATTALIALVGGCGGDPNKPKLAKVSGVIKYKGQPLANAAITFSPVGGEGAKTGQPATGQSDSSGRYSLTTFEMGDGAVLGEHVVTITARENSNSNQPKPDGTIDYVLPKSLIPEKYASPAKSPFKKNVEASGNSIDLELTD